MPWPLMVRVVCMVYFNLQTAAIHSMRYSAAASKICSPGNLMAVVPVDKDGMTSAWRLHHWMHRSCSLVVSIHGVHGMVGLPGTSSITGMATRYRRCMRTNINWLSAAMEMSLNAMMVVYICLRTMAATGQTKPMAYRSAKCIGWVFLRPALMMSSPACRTMGPSYTLVPVGLTCAAVTAWNV